MTLERKSCQERYINAVLSVILLPILMILSTLHNIGLLVCGDSLILNFTLPALSTGKGSGC